MPAWQLSSADSKMRYMNIKYLLSCELSRDKSRLYIFQPMSVVYLSNGIIYLFEGSEQKNVADIVVQTSSLSLWFWMYDLMSKNMQPDKDIHLSFTSPVKLPVANPRLLYNQIFEPSKLAAKFHSILAKVQCDSLNSLRFDGKYMDLSQTPWSMIRKWIYKEVIYRGETNS